MADTDAVIVQFIATQKEYEKQMAQIVRQSERAATAAEKAWSKSQDGIRRGTRTTATAITSDAGSSANAIGKTTQAAGQLSFQLNDIATSLSGGASPFQVMMQQGSQVAQVMNGLRASGVSMGRAVVGAFMTMLNPISLVSFALIAVAGYAYEFFTSVEEGGDKASKELKKHADALQSIADKYRALAPTAAAVIEKMLEQNKVRAAIDELNTSVQGLRTDGVTKLQTELEKITGISNKQKRALRDAFGGPGTADVLQDLTDRYGRLIDKLGKGEPVDSEVGELLRRLNLYDLEAPNAGFDKMANLIRSLFPLLQNLTQQQQAMVDMQKALTDEVQRTTGAFQGLLAAAGAMTGPLNLLVQALQKVDIDLSGIGQIPGMLAGGGMGLSSFYKGAVVSTPSAAKEFLKTKAGNDKIRSRIDQYDDDYAQLLAKLFTMLPDTAKIESGVRTFEEQYDIHVRRGVRPSAVPGRSRHEQRGSKRPEAADISGVSAGTLATAVGQIPELETLARINDPMHVQRAGTFAKAQEAAADATEKRAESYRDLLEQSRQATEMLTIEQQALANSAGVTESMNYQLQFRTYQQELLNKAQSEGIELTAQERAQIDQAADARARATVALAAQKENTKQLQEQQKQQQQAEQQFYETFGGIAKSAVGGFIQDLRNGVDAGEAFNNMLNRIIDSLVNLALEAVFSADNIKALFGGVGGGGGGGSWISNLIGGGGGAVPFYGFDPWGAGVLKKGGIVGKTRTPIVPFDPRAFRGARQYATGGIVPGAIPAWLHPGEVVIPNMKGIAASRGGAGTTNINNSNQRIRIDMGTDVVAANTEAARAFGENVRRIVAVEMVRESRPGGLLRRTGAAA